MGCSQLIGSIFSLNRSGRVLKEQGDRAVVREEARCRVDSVGGTGHREKSQRLRGRDRRGEEGGSPGLGGSRGPALT